MACPGRARAVRAPWPADRPPEPPAPPPASARPAHRPARWRCLPPPDTAARRAGVAAADLIPLLGGLEPHLGVGERLLRGRDARLRRAHGQARGVHVAAD